MLVHLYEYRELRSTQDAVCCGRKRPNMVYRQWLGSFDNFDAIGFMMVGWFIPATIPRASDEAGH